MIVPNKKMPAINITKAIDRAMVSLIPKKY